MSSRAMKLRDLVTHCKDIKAIAAWLKRKSPRTQKLLVQDLKEQQNLEEKHEQAGTAMATITCRIASTSSTTASEQHNHDHLQELHIAMRVSPIILFASAVLLHWLIQLVYDDKARSPYTVKAKLDKPTLGTEIWSYILYYCGAVLWWMIQVAWDLMCQSSWVAYAFAVLGLLNGGLTVPSFSMSVMENCWEKYTLGVIRWVYEVVAYAIKTFHDCLLNVEASTWFGFLAVPCVLINLVCNELTCHLPMLHRLHHIKVLLYRIQLETATDENGELVDDLFVHLFQASKNEELSMDGLSVDKHCDEAQMLTYLQAAKNIEDSPDNWKTNELDRIEHETYMKIKASQDLMRKILTSHGDRGQVEKPKCEEFWLVFHNWVAAIYMSYLWCQTFGDKFQNTKYWIIFGWQHCVPSDSSGGDCDMWTRATVRFVFFFAYMATSHVLKLNCVKKLLSSSATHLNAKLIYLCPFLWHLVQIYLEVLRAQVRRAQEDE